MKRLKGLITVIAVAGLFVPGLMFAQGNGQGNRGWNMDPEAMAKRQTDTMKDPAQTHRRAGAKG